MDNMKEPEGENTKGSKLSELVIKIRDGYQDNRGIKLSGRLSNNKFKKDRKNTWKNAARASRRGNAASTPYPVNDTCLSQRSLHIFGIHWNEIPRWKGDSASCTLHGECFLTGIAIGFQREDSGGGEKVGGPGMAVG